MEAINEKQGLILELKSFLFSTDYHVIKSYETGHPISDEVKLQREAARANINRIEKEINDLAKI